jgi:hypothetical protein
MTTERSHAGLAAMEAELKRHMASWEYAFGILLRWSASRNASRVRLIRESGPNLAVARLAVRQDAAAAVAALTAALSQPNRGNITGDDRKAGCRSGRERR